MCPDGAFDFGGAVRLSATDMLDMLTAVCGEHAILCVVLAGTNTAFLGPQIAARCHVRCYGFDNDCPPGIPLAFVRAHHDPTHGGQLPLLRLLQSAALPVGCVTTHLLWVTPWCRWTWYPALKGTTLMP